MLVDHHCHLDFPQLGEREDEVIANALNAGVAIMVTISTRVRELPKLLAITERHDNVYCSVGTHPHNAHEELDIDADSLAELARHPRVVAIGEAGLDYHYDNSPRQAQEQGFRTHIDAARKTGLPLVIHSRDADADMAEILEQEMARGQFSAVLHCFTGGRELARRALDIGLYVSFSGVVTFNKAEELRAIAADIPSDRILVETDSPYLAPTPHRGKQNEPAFVRHTAERLAAVRGVDLDTLAAQTTANFFRLYGKVPADRDSLPGLSAA